MRKFLSNGVIIFAGMASVPAIVGTVEAKLPRLAPLRAAEYKIDPRLQLLETFFENTEAPAKSYSHLFIAEADLYELDWRLLPSLSFIETTGGKAAKNNNMFGWDCGRAEFTSMSEGIRTVAYNLARSDRYRDKDLDELLGTYNPNPEYPRKVKSVMHRIAPVE